MKRHTEVHDKQSRVKEQSNALNAQIKTVKKDIEDKNNQLAAMNEICRNLKDDKNKEVKNMTSGKKGNFEKIKRAYNKADFVAVHILDDIAKFVTENPETNWKEHIVKLSDYDALMIELRKITRSNLDKLAIEAMMKEITGEAEDKEAKPDGPVYAALC